MGEKSQKIEKNFVETKCLFCESSDDRVVYQSSLNGKSFTSYTFSARRKREPEHYRIVACNNCSLGRSDPVIDESKLNELYAESRFIFPEEAPYAARTYQKLLKRMIDNNGLKVNSLMEIGCSNGFFLEKAIESGVNEVVGFEPSRDCWEHARENVRKHIFNDVFRPELLNGKKCDLACFFQVIDHLKDPEKTLCSVAQTLHPKGCLLLVCHDVESWTAKLLGNHSPIFDVEHIYLFSKKTIRMLLERTGFEVVEVGSLANVYPLSYWMRMLPLANRILDYVPGFLGDIPLGLKAGNLYAFGRKV